MNVVTGADVESLCSKCGDVWHVVVAMVGDKIAKVQCKECGAYHRYRPPNKKQSGAAGPRKRSPAKPKATGGSATRTEAPTIGPAIEPNLSRPIFPYKASESFEPADRIDHPKFGIGIVEASSPGKMEVYFPDGRRVLAQARGEARLERPRRVSFDE